MTSKARIIQEKSVVIPIEKLLGIDAKYEGKKLMNISEILSSYAYAKLSKRDQHIEGCVLRKIEFNKLACIVYFTWYELAWNSEE